MITIATSLGDIVIELFESSAPLSCENFRTYVDEDINLSEPMQHERHFGELMQSTIQIACNACLSAAYKQP